MKLRPLSPSQLDANQLSADGVGAICAALCGKNATLLSLSLAANDLSTLKACGFVADAIRASESLLELDISACHVSDRGAELLAAALEDNVVLDVLHYDGNRLSVDATSRLSYALGRLRRPIGQILDAIQSSATKRAAAAAEAERRRSAARVEAAPRLAPGQTLAVAISYGRKDNVVGEVQCGLNTVIAEARAMIDAAFDLEGDRDYKFVSQFDKLIALGEEDKRQVLYDCGRHVRLRPSTWIYVEDDAAAAATDVQPRVSGHAAARPRAARRAILRGRALRRRHRRRAAITARTPGLRREIGVRPGGQARALASLPVAPSGSRGLELSSAAFIRGTVGRRARRARARARISQISLERARARSSRPSTCVDGLLHRVDHLLRRGRVVALVVAHRRLGVHELALDRHLEVARRARVVDLLDRDVLTELARQRRGERGEVLLVPSSAAVLDRDAHRRVSHGRVRVCVWKASGTVRQDEREKRIRE